MRAAAIRHAILPVRDDGLVSITITRADGRYPEAFLLPQNELVRFARAVLADFVTGGGESGDARFELTELGLRQLEGTHA